MTAEDGTTKTYKVTVTRTVRSTDSSLSDLTLKDGEDDELNPTFSSGRHHLYRQRGETRNEPEPHGYRERQQLP